ncbi:HNH endonuclease [Nostoc sp. LEGE 06077]|nr:HNH endonuclease [Nostoc sp. LEGE 06077]
MGITDKTRKILWGRSGTQCAICKCELIMDAATNDDESIVGDECHIVAREVGGPRGDSSFPLHQLDSYSNLILLCKKHHKIVDDQPNEYTVKKLQEIKQKHLEYVRQCLEPPINWSYAKISEEYVGAGFIKKEIGTLWSNYANYPVTTEVVRFSGKLIAELVIYKDSLSPHSYELYQIDQDRYVVYYNYIHRADYGCAKLIGANLDIDPDPPLSLEEVQILFPELVTKAGLSRTMNLEF